jgi:hypothetical protein
MEWASYTTYPFTNDTGQTANGLHIRCGADVEIVSVDGKPPEGLGHGDYGINCHGQLIDIFGIETAPGRTLKVRIKGRTSTIVMTADCYWMKNGKKLKPLKIPENLVAASSKTKTPPDFKFKAMK